MDYEARIARTEAIMETNRLEIDRLYAAVSELRKLILERSDQLQAELVTQRACFDDSFREQRNRVDEGFKEVRREASINQRWMIGLTIANTTMILGLGGKLFGLY